MCSRRRNQPVRTGVQYGVDCNSMRVISDLLNALARRSERIRQGGKRSKLGKLFFRLFLFFTSVAITMEVFDLHVLGKTRALTTRIAVGIGMVTSLVMIWLL